MEGTLEAHRDAGRQASAIVRRAPPYNCAMGELPYLMVNMLGTKR